MKTFTVHYTHTTGVHKDEKRHFIFRADNAGQAKELCRDYFTQYGNVKVTSVIPN